jgi:DNA-binding transcriptional regulator YiaG
VDTIRRKTFKFNGFGFPIILLNAATKVENGEEILDVNLNRIQDMLFHALLLKPSRLSGAEVKFLRHYLELTQEAFSKTVKVERSLISKWESRDLKATGMSSHVEMFLRLKLTKLKNQSIDRNFSVSEPATNAKGVGKPIEIRLDRAS